MPGSRRVIQLDENTKIPLGLAWVVGLALVSIAMSFATILVRIDNVQAHSVQQDASIEFINRDRADKREQFSQKLDGISQEIRELKRCIKDHSTCE